MFDNLKLRCSCEGISIHIFNKRDAAGLLDNPLCDAAHLDIPKNKIQIQEDRRCCRVCRWPRHGYLF